MGVKQHWEGQKESQRYPLLYTQQHRESSVLCVKLFSQSGEVGLLNVKGRETPVQGQMPT